MQANAGGVQPVARSPGIYAIRNLTNGKVYVGSSRNVRERIQRHLRDLRSGHHFSVHLQSAWHLYGEASFTAELLETVGVHQELIEREQHWIDALRAYDPSNGYNSRPIANSNYGWTMPASGRQRISLALKGRLASTETREKLRIAATGRRHSEDARAKMSAAFTGRRLPPMSAQRKRRLSLLHTGKTLSSEHKQKLSLSHIGYVMPAEQRAKISQSLRGKKKPPRTVEHVAALRKASMGRKASEDTRKKMSVALSKPRVSRRCFTSDEAVTLRALKASGLSYSQLQRIYPVSVCALFNAIHSTYMEVST